MNTIIIITVLILLVISLIINISQYVKIKDNKQREQEYKVDKDLSTEEKKNLRSVLKTTTEDRDAKGSNVTILLSILRLIVLRINDKHKSNIVNDIFPFVFKAKEERLITPLNSIRFKKDKEKINIYLNGAMAPTDDIIILENYTSLDDKDAVLYNSLLSILNRDFIMTNDIEELKTLITK